MIYKIMELFGFDPEDELAEAGFTFGLLIGAALVVITSIFLVAN